MYICIHKKIVKIKVHLINIYAFYCKRVDILYTERRAADLYDQVFLLFMS